MFQKMFSTSFKKRLATNAEKTMSDENLVNHLTGTPYKVVCLIK